MDSHSQIIIHDLYMIHGNFDKEFHSETFWTPEEIEIFYNFDKTFIQKYFLNYFDLLCFIHSFSLSKQYMGLIMQKLKFD